MSEKIITRPVTDEYAEGWERIFGRKPKPGEWIEIDVPVDQLKDMPVVQHDEQRNAEHYFQSLADKAWNRGEMGG